MKQLIFLSIAALLAISACTLGTAQNERAISLNATETALPFLTLTSPPTTLPTPLLQSNGSTSVGVTCPDRLRVDVGTDPGNTLRLREQPNNNSNIILLIPNNSIVTRVSGSLETSAGGYTWVNIQFTDPNGVVATGWAAKDAMKDRTTLVAAGC